MVDGGSDRNTPLVASVTVGERVQVALRKPLGIPDQMRRGLSDIRHREADT